MNTVKFKNGKTFETIAVYGSPMTFQNANRDTLEFRIAEDNATFDELKAVYSDPDALSEIEITEREESMNNEVTSLHLHYTLPVELGSKQLGGESVWCMKVAQKSELELALAKQAADINDTQAALIELADIIAGGEE